MAIAVKNIFLFFLLFLLTKGASAQRAGVIRGHLTDTVDHQALNGALITVSGVSDPSFVRRSFSNKDASFEIASLPYGIYSVRISFQGFEPVLRIVHPDNEHPIADMGILYLRIRVSELDSVQVEEPPMILKKDTIAYNASRWQTQPYAPLADLLEQLPGVRVNGDGSITVNGQPVDKILVDGKPFFNGDPNMALQHLPAEIVRQIQVYGTSDGKTPLAGIPQGSSGNKTLNLVLKSNRRRGEFGKAGAGMGLTNTRDGVYDAVADFNYMNGGQQLSIAGDAGNVDGLNTGKSGGGTIINGPGEYGITRRWNGGVNYRDTWNDHTDVNGSYMSGQRHTDDMREMHTLNLFPHDSSTVLDQQTNNITKNNRQQLNFTIEDRLDASNSLTVRPSMLLQHSESRSSGQSRQSSGQSGAIIYQSSTNNTSISDAKTASADILYQHKGDLPSRLFSAGLAIYGNQTGSNSADVSQTDYAVPATSVGSLNQHVANTLNIFNLSPSISYTMPVGKRDLLDLQSSYLYNSSRSQNQAFRYNGITHEFDQDPSQSNNFTTIYSTARALADYRIQRSHYTIVVGAGIESDQLQGKNLSDNSTIKSRYINWLPSANVTIHHDNGRSIQIGYSGKPVALTVQQLQPVTMTVDSLIIQQGNPLLKQPFVHAFTVSYSSIRPGSQRFFSVMASGSMTVDAVQNSVTLLNNGAQVFRPVNMNGATNVYASANYTIPLARQHSNIGVTANIRYSRDPGLSNGLKSDTRMFNLSGEVSWSYYAGKRLSFDFDAVSSYNILRYSQDQDQRNDYFAEMLSSRLKYIIRDWTVSLTGAYSLNNSLTRGYQPLAPILSPAISRRLFKLKAAEIRLCISDLLNQQSGAQRTATPNSITDMSVKTRGRYGMLSFIYNISRFKAGK